MKFGNLFLLPFLTFLQFSALAQGITDLKDINTALTEKAFSGNLIIAQGGQIVFQQQYGIANREQKIAYDKDTVFGIGSVTKQFVATAILKLQEQGKLSVNDTLESFFDNVPEDKKAISVHHLLTQSSGFMANFDKEPLYGLMPHSSLPQRAFDTKLVFSPGESYAYSNIGYSLLARIIEKVSGQNWEAYIRQNILLPAGLSYTGYRLPKYERNKLAINYGADQNAFQRMFKIKAKSKSVGHSLSHLLKKPGERWFEGAGGFLSTQDDMFKWYLAIRDQQVLTEQSWNLMHSPHVKENPEQNWFYGYGWAITELNEHDRITHNGSNGYNFAEFSYFPDLDLFIFVSTNDIDNYPEETINSIYKFIVAKNNSPEVAIQSASARDRLY
ncbi:serine hydrolase domain-containing protein [Glaciecola sp. 1036]|uniref:serine hydrolase domain-containing protein n=1 Tax=Alteromonadaceae TaxID=72275 RepID=UPI003D02D92F